MTKIFPNVEEFTLARVRMVSCRFWPVRALSLCQGRTLVCAEGGKGIQATAKIASTDGVRAAAVITTAIQRLASASYWVGYQASGVRRMPASCRLGALYK